MVVVGLLAVGLVTFFGHPQRPLPRHLRHGRRHGGLLRGHGAGGHPGTGARLLAPAAARRGHGLLDAGPGPRQPHRVPRRLPDGGRPRLAVPVPGGGRRRPVRLRPGPAVPPRARAQPARPAHDVPARAGPGRGPGPGHPGRGRHEAPLPADGRLEHRDPVDRRGPLPPDLPLGRRLLRDLLRVRLRLQPVGGQRAGQLVLVGRRRRRRRRRASSRTSSGSGSPSCWPAASWPSGWASSSPRSPPAPTPRTRRSSSSSWSCRPPGASPTPRGWPPTPRPSRAGTPRWWRPASPSGAGSSASWRPVPS